MNRTDALLIDAGTGNLHSVHNALLSLGFSIRVTSDPADLSTSNRVILPGVGAFGSFMEGLRSRGLEDPLREAFRRGDPLFGICVGMQALFEMSEEMGEHRGLGLLPGRVVRFGPQPALKIPHTGWNQLWFEPQAHLFRDLPGGVYAYFNHSFYCANAILTDASARTDYGSLNFTSAVQHGSLYGVQFHPEKSQRVGQKVLANFFKS
jgi:glutamine amidotransferase